MAPVCEWLLLGGAAFLTLGLVTFGALTLGLLTGLGFPLVVLFEEGLLFVELLLTLLDEDLEEGGLLVGLFALVAFAFVVFLALGLATRPPFVFLIAGFGFGLGFFLVAVDFFFAGALALDLGVELVAPVCARARLVSL